MQRKSDKPRGRPFEKGDARAGRPKGTPNKVTVEIRELARSMILDEGYQKKLRADLHSGKLPPPLVALLFHYGFGKPKETHELTGPDGGPIESVSRIEVVLVDGKNAKD